jgi:hypothetical protein
MNAGRWIGRLQTGRWIGMLPTGRWNTDRYTGRQAERLEDSISMELVARQKKNLMYGQTRYRYWKGRIKWLRLSLTEYQFAGGVWLGWAAWQAGRWRGRQHILEGSREMENVIRGSTFGDFVTIVRKGLMQNVTVARLQSTRVQNPLYLPYSFKCNVLRESLSVDSQNIPCATLKRRGS